MEREIDKQSSIARHVIDGSISIDSIQEFQMLIELFPDNPVLHRAFSDLLVKKKKYAAAVREYERACRHFIDSGMPLQAVVSKALQWRIMKPSKRDFWAFYSLLHKGRSQETPIQAFFSRIAFPELVAIIMSFKLTRLPASKVIRKFGAPENDINFVVSGALRQTTYHPMVKGKKVQRKTSRQLSEGDFFGEIYPFEEERLSQSSVETLSRVELVVITKEKMMAVCKRYPNIELGIIDLHKTRAQAEEETRRMVRKAQRHQMAIKMDIDVYPEEAGRSPLVLSGFSRDISLGGVCVVLDPKYKDVFPSYMIGRTARIRIMLSNEAITLSILGTIAWTTQVAVEGRTTEALGIQFKEMAPKLSGTLVAFASIISDF